MDFLNPFLSPFASNLSPTQASQHQQSTRRDSNFLFRDSLAGVDPLSGSCDVTAPSKTYQDPFSWDLQDDEHAVCQSQADVDQEREHSEPFRLIINRAYPTNTTQLCDPLNNDIIYSVKETFPYSFSPGPDLEIERTISGDVTIGTVHYGVVWDEMVSATSGMYHGKINEFKPRHLQEASSGKALSWRIKKRKHKPRWSSIDGKGLGMKITQPILMFELVDTSNANRKPLCRVSMFTTRPIGVIEVFAKSACVNHEGGDWTALDELILSAYANMERARMRLMCGSSIQTCGTFDKTEVSWPGFVLNPIIAPPEKSPIGWI